MATGRIAILGSGETAPGMTKVHREFLAPLDPVRAVNLDTTYGFQLNVPQMSAKLEEYFSTSLLTRLNTLHFSSYQKSSELERTLFKQQVRQANYVFAGPGSPTYALAQWKPLQLQDDLISVLQDAGGLCFASAAALTLGAFTAPIYEVYKVGTEDPQWHEGLDVLGAFGLNCVVIPHFDNNEGANYDTRYCYLGEPRLLHLERQLPEGVATLGVDEHTALLFDFDRDTVAVKGRSNGYWRLGSQVQVLERNSVTPLADFRTKVYVAKKDFVADDRPPQNEPSKLAEVVLSGGPKSLGALAQLVQLATKGGEGFIDPSALVKALLSVRAKARTFGQYELADQLRDALLDAGFDIQDGPTTSTWSIKTDD